MTNFDEFWARYPGKKVAKPKCRDKYEKLDDETHKRILLAIEAQGRYRHQAKRSGDFMADWCNSQTFINQERWDDEIGSTVELKEKAESRICSVEGCTEAVHAPKAAGQWCYHHVSYDAYNRLRPTCILVPEIRQHYQDHQELHNLRGEAALKFCRAKIRGLLS